MGGIDTISSYFLEFEWKVGKHLTGQDVKGNRVLPYPELLKPSIDVLSIHDVLISQIVLFFNDTKDKASIPIFHYSNCERSELSSIIRQGEYLSGGAGISSVMPTGQNKKIGLGSALSDVERRYYSPQPTPEAVYKKYLQWLIEGRRDPTIEIFTLESQRYLGSLPMTKAYFNFMLMHEYGKKYEICIKNGVALLYFTDDPLVCPHFFQYTDKGWQMDIWAEVRNTRDRVGGVYLWDYSGSNDIYTKTFVDKLVNIKNYLRIADGDNRELPIRGVL